MVKSEVKSEPIDIECDGHFREREATGLRTSDCNSTRSET